jgi:hypothetical protein
MLLLATRERASRATPAIAMAMTPMRSGLGRRVEALVDGRPLSAVRRLSAMAAAVVLAAGIVTVPAPRLSVAGEKVVAATAAETPLTNAPRRTLRPPPPGYWIYVPKSAPNRAILLPIGDSLPRRPRTSR